MKIRDFVQLAKEAQNALKAMNMSAEHIYVSDLSLVFISKKYSDMDLYHRAALASAIQKGPLKINYHMLGVNHLSSSASSITREQIYSAVKIYGKKPLLLNGGEYASSYDKMSENQQPG